MVTGQAVQVAGSARAPAVVERRREELGSFLMARRARLSPEDCGIPRGARRRTPGLLYRLAEATPSLSGTARGPVPAEIGEIVRSLDPLPASLANLQVPAMADTRLLVHTPADEQTRARLPLTRRPAHGTPNGNGFRSSRLRPSRGW